MMPKLRVSLAFATFGALLPSMIMTTDRMSVHGWWPKWVIYVWPTSYMFLGAEAPVARMWYESAAVSVGLNALLYAVVGFTLISLLKTRKRTAFPKS
jgi:hypothetical protein